MSRLTKQLYVMHSLHQARNLLDIVARCLERRNGCIATAAMRSVYPDRVNEIWRMQALEEKGHKVETSSWGAVVQGILVDPSDGYLTGVSDPRKDGAPSGY